MRITNSVFSFTALVFEFGDDHTLALFELIGILYFYFVIKQQLIFFKLIIPLYIECFYLFAIKELMSM